MVKFRGKRIDNGKGVCGMLMHKWACGTQWNKYLAIQLAEEGNSYLVIPSTIAQFTGLKDKNQVEIYGSIEIDGVMSEGGDIVKVEIDVYNGIYVCEYQTDMALFEFKGEGEWLTWDDIGEGAEIIGNQTDNKDLLK